jgi:hypothetical protein
MPDTRSNGGVQPGDSGQLPETLRSRFWQQGYAVIPAVFSPAEIDRAKRELLEIARAEGRLDGPGPRLGSRTLNRQAAAYPAARHLLFCDKVLWIVQALLSHRPVYFGDSSVNFGHGYTGWHKDNRVSDRKDGGAPDWQGDYDLIRVGVYLQDCAHHSGGLLVRAGSHLNAPHMPRWASSGGGPAGALMRRLVAFRSRFNGVARFVDSRIGDVVVWTLRTTHAGHAVRVRGMSRLLLDPRVQPMVPGFLQVPQDGFRVAAFATFARPGAHYERYKKYLLGRDYFADRPADPIWQFGLTGVIVDEIGRA